MPALFIAASAVIVSPIPTPRVAAVEPTYFIPSAKSCTPAVDATAPAARKSTACVVLSASIPNVFIVCAMITEASASPIPSVAAKFIAASSAPA